MSRKIMIMLAAAAIPATAALAAQTSLVTGNALITFGAVNGEQHWQFTARQEPIGQVEMPKGQLQLVMSQANGGRVHGSIVCVTTDATTHSARLGARVEKSTTPLAPVGSYLAWTVRDNGEGANDLPDETSDLLPLSNERAARIHCFSDTYNLLLVPVERGNIQVH